MAIDWEEIKTDSQMAQKGYQGIGGSGETYSVWCGTAFLNADTAVQCWVAQGWPEYDSDSLPLFESYEDAVTLCEQWEEIKLDAEARARAAFTGVRAGQG